MSITERNQAIASEYRWGNAKELAAKYGVHFTTIVKIVRGQGVTINDTPLIERFKRRYTVNKETGCWEWQGTMANGYGVISVNNVLQLAHRVSYELFVDSIPSGALICHRCDNRPCVNPEHLYAGDYSDNMRDAQERGQYFRERARNVRLKQTTVDEIRELYSTGSYTQKELAEKFGIAQAHVSRLVHFVQWPKN